ncbi:MAG: hypothetical protein ACI4DY_07565 [Monoglobaceae bacterium]
MSRDVLYCSYDNYVLMYNLIDNSFSVLYGNYKVLQDAHIKLLKKSDHREYFLSAYSGVITDRKFNTSDHTISIKYYDSKIFQTELVIEFKLSRFGIKLIISGLAENEACIKSPIQWGVDNDNTFAVCLDKNQTTVRAGIGPAVSKSDNALYDRLHDNAFVIDGGKKVRLNYDWNIHSYTLSLETGLVEHQQRFNMFVKNNILAKKYGINYAPINKNCTFKKAPAGWMTWYAVRFNASEKTVLENAKWQSENLKDFGANAIWVDWEWYHKDFSGSRDDGANTFVPDGEKYPHGLKYISDEIRKLGLIPALWIGFTHDSSHNEFTKEHPEIILNEKISWCGKYFYDFSHPDYLCKFLPKALKQVSDWCYDAVKFDTLPILIDYHEENHMDMFDPTLTTKQAFRNAMGKTREILGENTYMLSCAATKNADLLWAADIFDAARVGLDIFAWEDFIAEGVKRVLNFYPMHNYVLYLDPDNVILREDLNNDEQAASRAFFVAMLGLPMNFGDNLLTLSEKRVELLKRCLPVMDIHPMALRETLVSDNGITINLAIEKVYESYNVIDVFNFSEESVVKKICFDSDLDLEDGEYLVYNYSDKKFEGIISDFIYVELKSYESKIYSIRKKISKPQIVSTSRHMTQGAAEIINMRWIDDVTFEFESELVKNDNYEVYMHIPEEYMVESSGAFTLISEHKSIAHFGFLPPESKQYIFQIKFII